MPHAALGILWAPTPNTTHAMHDACTQALARKNYDRVCIMTLHDTSEPKHSPVRVVYDGPQRDGPHAAALVAWNTMVGNNSHTPITRTQALPFYDGILCLLAKMEQACAPATARIILNAGLPSHLDCSQIGSMAECDSRCCDLRKKGWNIEPHWTSFAETNGHNTSHCSQSPPYHPRPTLRVSPCAPPTTSPRGPSAPRCRVPISTSTATAATLRTALRELSLHS